MRDACYNVAMKSLERLGILPSLLIGAALFVLGLLAMSYIVNNFWPFDVNRLDLVRGSVTGQADAPLLLEAADMQILLAFLATVLMAVTGLALPLAWLLNKRLDKQAGNPNFWVVFRQAVGAGFWVAFLVWLQMNRALGLAVALLVAGVLILFEIMLQIRSRAASVESAS